LVTWLERALLVGWMVALFGTPLGRLVEGWAISSFGDSLVAVLAFFAVIGVLWELISLPMNAASQQIERQYGLSKQSWKSWFGDVLKGWVLSAILGGGYLAAVAAIIRSGVTYYWLWISVLTAVFTVLLAQLAPVVLLPLFIPMERLPDGAVRSRLLALCQRFQIKVREVYLLKMGVKTEKANAAFMGLGPTKRIAIGDTLCREATEDEIEAVFAHELGHQVNNDVVTGVAMGIVSVTFVFWAAAFALYFLQNSFRGVSAYGGLWILLFFGLSGVLQMILAPLMSAWSRQRERAADDFAVKAGLAVPLRDALSRLVVQNWGLFYPGRIKELGMSHPAPWRRLTRLADS